ncbi:6-bladed beta-propeller [Rapidithrix thailandica]|uniref:6-bladed beta-propeller n=1 Tax=Rapidithrix thailandica TaxID=413964 RepID=A0AAW9S3Q0_9BACT
MRNYKIMTHYLVLAVFFINLIACTGQEHNTRNGEPALPVIKVNTEDSIKNYKEIISGTPELIPLETSENSIIGTIDKLIHYNNKYFILDTRKTKAVFCFDSEGKLLFKINRVGNGVGEFIMPFDFDIAPEEKLLKVIDINQGKMINFSLDGTFVNEEKLPSSTQLMSFCIIDKHHYAFHKDGRDYGQGLTNFIKVYNKTQNTFINEGVYDIGNTDTYKIFNEFAKYNDHISFVHAWTDTIYHISKSEIQPAYTIDFGKGKITQKIKTMDLPKMGNFFLKNRYVFHTGQITENKDFISFQWVKSDEGFEKTGEGSFTTYFIKKGAQVLNISQNKNWIAGTSIKGPLNIANEYFIGYLEAGEISNTNKGKSIFTDLNLNENSNPVLIRYKIKLNNVQ